MFWALKSRFPPKSGKITSLPISGTGTSSGEQACLSVILGALPDWFNHTGLILMEEPVKAKQCVSHVTHDCIKGQLCWEVSMVACIGTIAAFSDEGMDPGNTHPV